MITLQILKANYALALEKAFAEKRKGYETQEYASEVIADKMIAVIRNCINNHGHNKSGCDWLRHNPALKEAAKSLGIKTSKQLREEVAI